MQHRHLLPNELDLLLDSEVGFGLAPLREHADSCLACHARLREAREVAVALDALPRHAPGPSFADRVMAQVQVVEPWHVALAASARRLVPASVPMRTVMVATAGVVALGVSSAAVWLSFRTDVAMYLAGLASDRLRQGIAAALVGAARSLLGDGAIAAAATGGRDALLVGTLVVTIAAGSAVLGLRALATASRRARE
jgi:hypothetical protein